MGRLLRKKTIIKKKKKSDDNAISSEAVQSDTNKDASTGDDVSKKQPIAPKKLYIPPKPAAPPPVPGDKNYLQKSTQFLREVKAELKKVVWPARKQTIGSTLIVIILVIIISFFLGLVDVGLSNLVRVVLQQ